MGKKGIVIFLSIMAAMLLILGGCHSKKEAETIRIGYQKNGPLVILKGLGTLEERLEPMGYKVEWKEFQNGPSLVEALNAESIDIGRTGNSPVIFAQAAEANFVIWAAGPSKFHGSGILVPKDSPIKSLEDLKGKKVSFSNGSSSHYLIVKALEKAGLQYTDIEPAFLTPGDARVAFEQGNVDAMVVWDPYTASTELHSDGVLLVNGEGLSTDRDFFVATNSFDEAHPDMREVILDEVAKSSDWANNNQEDLVALLVPLLNLDEESLTMAAERRFWGVDEITTEIIEEQQDIANIFYELDIIPKKLDVREVMSEQ